MKYRFNSFNYSKLISYLLNHGYFFTERDSFDCSKHINGYITVNGKHAKIIDCNNILALG